METPPNDDYGDDQDYDVEIYSKQAIFWFTVLVSPLYGGVLLMINLWSAGHRRATVNIIFFLIIFFLLEGFLVRAVPLDVLSKQVMVIGLNVAAGFLFRYFFDSYFPDDDYYPKSIAAPLIVALVLIILLYIGAMQAGMPQLLSK